MYSRLIRSIFGIHHHLNPRFAMEKSTHAVHAMTRVSSTCTWRRSRYWRSMIYWVAISSSWLRARKEVGSDNLGIFVKANKEKLKADVILISDTSLISLTNLLLPLVCAAWAIWRLKWKVPIAIYIPVCMAEQWPIHQCIEQNDCIDARWEWKKSSIPGFYDKVAELSAAEQSD